MTVSNQRKWFQHLTRLLKDHKDFKQVSFKDRGVTAQKGQFVLKFRYKDRHEGVMGTLESDYGSSKYFLSVVKLHVNTITDRSKAEIYELSSHDVSLRTILDRLKQFRGA